MIDPRYFAFISVFAFREFSPFYRDIVSTMDPWFSKITSFLFSLFPLLLPSARATANVRAFLR